MDKKCIEEKKISNSQLAKKKNGEGRAHNCTDTSDLLPLVFSFVLIVFFFFLLL